MAGLAQPQLGGHSGGLRPLRPRRRQNLTPMIDVIFLLLVFFMLAARFGAEDRLPLETASAAGGAAYSGPPRLIDVGADGLRLNGQAVSAAELAARLSPLVTGATDAILLRADEGAPLQALVQLMDDLRAAGFVTLVLVD